MGRLYIIGGLIYVIVLTIGVGLSGQPAFDSAIPILLPVFGVLGSFGALTAFANDRIKGVFEYLISYGMTPRSLFTTTVVASLAAVTLTLGIASAVALGASVFFFGSISWTFAGLLGFYALPMSYASAAFASQVGMYFTALSSPRAGISSPIGIMPLVGMAPSLLTLFAVGVVGTEFGTGSIYVVMAVGLLAVMVVVFALLSMAGRMLRAERFLSPA